MSTAAVLPRPINPRDCECAGRCGDDPRLARGQADHCAAHQAHQRELAEAGECYALQRRLADEAATARLMFLMPRTTPDGQQWLDLTALKVLMPTPMQPEQLRAAVRYLQLRHLITVHPEHPHLVRLLRPTTATGDARR